MVRIALALAVLQFAVHAMEYRQTSGVTVNPVRKVVNLLENMQKKVVAEEMKEKELHEKFVAYCSTYSNVKLRKECAADRSKIDDLVCQLKAGKAQLIQVGEDLAKHTTEEKAAKAAMSEATALREKEAAAFAAQDADDKKNIAAIKKAITAIKKGQTEFLQTGEAQEVQRLIANKQDIDDADKRDVLSFFSQQEGGPGSAAIVGILQNMLDVMSKGAQEAAAAEAASVSEYEQLKVAKDSELQALTSAIEKKTQRQGELSVKNADTENDLTDTKESLKQNEKLLTQLDKECDSKEAQYEQNKKMRAEELAAIAETIKILNEDDALDLFKKTLPEGGSFLQVRVNAQILRQRAIEAIHTAMENSRSPHLDFITLALRGKKIGFEKIIKMIDDLVSTLKKQEKDDEDKKAYCTTEMDTTEDKIKNVKGTKTDVESALDDAKESVSSLGDDREALKNGIEDLDKSVADSTAQRKEEHADFMELMTSDTAAKEILQFAKNRLNKFYNPALYKPPPKKRTFSSGCNFRTHDRGYLRAAVFTTSNAEPVATTATRDHISLQKKNQKNLLGLSQ